MAELNYRHLRYFWAIAQEHSLTRAAERLHVSQSALSIQLRQLEDRLGHRLFLRDHKRLTLTDAGRIALDHAQVIFRTGDDLLASLKSAEARPRQVLRVGAVATLSRNFQIDLLRPLLDHPELELVLRSASLRELLTQLGAGTLDLLLSNVSVQGDAENDLHCHLLAQQPVSLVGRPGPGSADFRFPDDLAEAPLLLPSLHSDIRARFDGLLADAGIRPCIAAEVDDMAMLRLLARESQALALVPPVVVQDELASGALVERCKIPQLQENFYAILRGRPLPGHWVDTLLHRPLGC